MRRPIPRQRIDKALAFLVYVALLITSSTLADGHFVGVLAGFACAIAARGLIDLWHQDSSATD